MEEPCSQGLILAVDDSPENLGILFHHLDEAGFTVLLVQNSENALEQARDTCPDLILLDVMMPGLDGFDVCHRLKANEVTKDIPVVFMTALTDTKSKVKGFGAGGVDYITKPFHPEEVVARVRTHLIIRRLQEELQEKNALLEHHVELLAEKNTQLNDVNVSQNKFFSIIAHDLRGPLYSLRELSNLMLEDFEHRNKEELIRMLTAQRNTTANLYALLENLLTWARIQRGKLEYFPQTVFLNQVATVNVDLLHMAAEQKQITLKNLIQEKITAYADYHMINTILRNLLSNAVKFTNSGGNVNVRANQEDNSVTVTVSDTGIGISKQHLPELFRIDAHYMRSGTANERGTGLGLILCKEFIERNNGTIWIESEIGKGTTVNFTLPTDSKALLEG
jgi:signal transduction histidine kinase